MWVIVALACLVFLLILLLSIPIEFRFSARISEEPSFKARILWFFGLLDQDLKKKSRSASIKREEPKPDQKKRIKVSAVLTFFKNRDFLRQCLVFVKRILKSITIKKFLLHANLGFENPSDTAILYALAGPLNYLCDKPDRDIKLNPVFDGDLYIDISANVIVRAIPLYIMGALLQFVFSIPVLRISSKMAMMQWKKA